ncbi:ABC transporter permease [Mangrovimonas sp. CR14]|uniref:ABC transporter permease n=1 Tax=Mangrovimonas sp. CR14 TaxID=2706120 RepID=UPI001423FF4A|nr:ABC transporter permease [Mangrovimonas sp. CR14]NIK92514.1 ABC transporter permease [Mangrovimonas sp. CR14]
MKTRTYRKDQQLKLSFLLGSSLKDIYASRFLATQLAVRDIKAQYRQSFLGVFWAFITPLMTALVWMALKQSGTVALSDTGIPYPVYVFSGTLIWSIIIEAINSPISSTNSAKSILTKINFPKEALLVSGIFKLLFNSLVKVVLLVLFILFYGMGWHWSMLLFPLGMLGAIFVGTTLGLLVTPLGLLYKDISKLIGFGMRFLMYATPVVYSIPTSGFMRSFMTYNPFTPLVTVPRDLLTGMLPEFLGYYGIILFTCLPLLFFGLVFYRFSIPIVVERLSS